MAQPFYDATDYQCRFMQQFSSCRRSRRTCTGGCGAGKVEGEFSMLTKYRTFGLMLALLAGLAVLGAACLGGDDDDVEQFGNEDTTYDADDVRSLCNLLTRDEVAEILEVGVSGTSATQHHDGVSCLWFIDYTVGDLPDGGPVSVRFYTEAGQAAFDTIQATYDTEEVAGLGDAAYHAPDVFSLYVLTGDDTALSVLDAVYQRAWTRPENWAEDLAAAVIEKCAPEAAPLRPTC